MSCWKSFLAVLLVVLLYMPYSATAQGREKRIRFAGLQRTISCKGQIPATVYDYDAFVLSVAAKQQISVSLQSADREAYFVIYALDLGPADDLIASIKDSKRGKKQWFGRLPAKGSYSFQVYGKHRGAPYILLIRRR